MLTVELHCMSCTEHCKQRVWHVADRKCNLLTKEMRECAPQVFSRAYRHGVCLTSKIPMPQTVCRARNTLNE